MSGPQNDVKRGGKSGRSTGSVKRRCKNWRTSRDGKGTWEVWRKGC